MLRSSEDANISKAATEVPQNFIFDHPTLRALAGGIAELINPGTGSESKDQIKDIEDMVAKYTKNMPTAKKDWPHPSQIVVLLTGSTGNVGCHVLESLLSEPRISKVYTFNRPSAVPQAERQKDAFEARNLPVAALESPKLVYLVGDLAIENFGLEKEIFDEVRVNRSLSYEIERLTRLHRSRHLCPTSFTTLGRSISTIP